MKSSGLAMALSVLGALGAMHVAVAGDSSPGTNAAARVLRLGQNVERAESVRAVKRVQEMYAQVLAVRAVDRHGRVVRRRRPVVIRQG